MNISREDFINIMTEVEAQIIRDNYVAKAVDELIKDGANRPVVYTTPGIYGIIKILDKDGSIDWWMHDGPDFGRKSEYYQIYENGLNKPSIEIKTAGDLYDYIVRNNP